MEELDFHFICIWIFFGACEKKEGKNWEEKKLSCLIMV